MSQHRALLIGNQFMALPYHSAAGRAEEVKAKKKKSKQNIGRCDQKEGAGTARTQRNKDPSTTTTTTTLTLELTQSTASSSSYGNTLQSNPSTHWV